MASSSTRLCSEKISACEKQRDRRKKRCYCWLTSMGSSADVYTASISLNARYLTPFTPTDKLHGTAATAYTCRRRRRLTV